MPTGGSIFRLVHHVDGEAVSELAAVVGQDGMDVMREVGEEPLEEAGGGLAIAVGMDFQVDVTGCAIDGHKSVALALLQSWQMLQIDMNEANACLFEHAHCWLVGLGPTIEAVAHEAAVDGTARELRIDAAPHDFGNVVERQLKLSAQLTDESFLQW